MLFSILHSKFEILHSKKPLLKRPLPLPHPFRLHQNRISSPMPSEECRISNDECRMKNAFLNSSFEIRNSSFKKASSEKTTLPPPSLSPAPEPNFLSDAV